MTAPTMANRPDASPSPDTLKICSLPTGSGPSGSWPTLETVELHATLAGEPRYYFPEVGVTLSVGALVMEADRQAVNAWQADPDNDSLRARGDARWQAACSFTQRQVADEEEAIRNLEAKLLAWQASCPHRETTLESRTPVGDMGEAQPPEAVEVCQVCGHVLGNDGPIPF